MRRAGRLLGRAVLPALCAALAGCAPSSTLSLTATELTADHDFVERASVDADANALAPYDFSLELMRRCSGETVKWRQHLPQEEA